MAASIPVLSCQLMPLLSTLKTRNIHIPLPPHNPLCFPLSLSLSKMASQTLNGWWSKHDLVYTDDDPFLLFPTEMPSLDLRYSS